MRERGDTKDKQQTLKQQQLRLLNSKNNAYFV